jgi:hypothetical protein
MLARLWAWLRGRPQRPGRRRLRYYTARRADLLEALIGVWRRDTRNGSISRVAGLPGHGGGE